MDRSHPLYPPGTLVEVVDPHSRLKGYRAVVVEPVGAGLGEPEPGSLLIRVIGRPPPGTRRLWAVRESHVRAVPGQPD